MHSGQIVIIIKDHCELKLTENQLNVLHSLGLQQSYLQLLSYLAELKSRMRMRWPCVQVEYREGSRGVGATNETCFMLFTQAPLMSAVFAPSGRRQSDTLAIASLSSVGLTQVILSLNSLGYNPNTLHSAQSNSSIINTESASILLFLLQLGTQEQYQMVLKAC